MDRRIDIPLDKVIYMEKHIYQIPASRDPYTCAPLSEDRKRRVAAYARVSTDNKDQVTSYQAQIDYYRKYIQSHNNWELVHIYTDEGITGTSIRHREGFQTMISDALSGKIDLIITKSVSRFARNTVDCLTTIRRLKEGGVECFFQRENLWTFDGKGELFLTLMSSIAQEEARTVSENCTWGQRKRMKEGKVTIPFSSFLGYDRGQNGEPVINEKEAVIVRQIYNLFLGGETYHGIARRLTEEGIKTPTGKDTWHAETIRHILTNEKYKGDALLQKTFTVDYLSKKRKINQGEIPQIYVEGSHEAIISQETFEQVRVEIKRRKKE